MKRCVLLIGIAMLVLALPLAAQDFPAKGRTITMIVPNTAGGGTDTAARLFAPLMEKDLGVRVEVVSKPGAGTQIGLTMATAAKPDGYTLVWTVFPATAGIYLDPDRKAAFGRKDLQPIAIVYNSPFAVAMRSEERTITGETTLGRMCRQTTLRELEPSDVGASTKRRLFVLSVAAWVTLAKDGTV